MNYCHVSVYYIGSLPVPPTLATDSLIRDLHLNGGRDLDLKNVWGLAT